MGGNQVTTKFSRLETHITKYGSDLQTFKHDVLENLSLATDTFFATFHWGTAFTFAPGFVLPIPTIHIIYGYIIAAGQITHRISAISN